MSIFKALVSGAGLLLCFTDIPKGTAEEQAIFSKATILVINKLTQKTLEKRISGDSERTRTQLGEFVSITPKSTWKSETGHFCRSYTEQIIDINSKQLKYTRVACRSKKGRWEKVGAE